MSRGGFETPEQVDELVERLKFGKLMITPLDQIKKPSQCKRPPTEAA